MMRVSQIDGARIFVDQLEPDEPGELGESGESGELGHRAADEPDKSNVTKLTKQPASSTKTQSKEPIALLRDELLAYLAEPRSAVVIYTWAKKRGYHKWAAHGYLRKLLDEGVVRRMGTMAMPKWQTTASTPQASSKTEPAQRKHKPVTIDAQAWLAYLQEPRTVGELGKWSGLGRRVAWRHLARLRACGQVEMLGASGSHNCRWRACAGRALGAGRRESVSAKEPASRPASAALSDRPSPSEQQSQGIEAAHCGHRHSAETSPITVGVRSDGQVLLELPFFSADADSKAGKAGKAGRVQRCLLSGKQAQWLSCQLGKVLRAGSSSSFGP